MCCLVHFIRLPSKKNKKNYSIFGYGELEQSAHRRKRNVFTGNVLL